MLHPAGEGQNARASLIHDIQNNSSFGLLSTIRKPKRKKFLNVTHQRQNVTELKQQMMSFIYLYTYLYIFIYIYLYIFIYIFLYLFIYIYTGCKRRNGPDFGRVFLRSNYTDITQNTYIQSSMVTEILAREV